MAVIKNALIVVGLSLDLKEKYKEIIKEMGYNNMTQELTEHIRNLVKEHEKHGS